MPDFGQEEKKFIDPIQHAIDMLSHLNAARSKLMLVKRSKPDILDIDSSLLAWETNDAAHKLATTALEDVSRAVQQFLESTLT